MRSKSLILAAAPLAFALAACGSGGTVVEDPSDPEQIAAAMAELPQPEAGEYSMTGELIEFELPGVSEEEMGMMRGMFEAGLSGGQTFCITEEMLEDGFQSFLSQSQNVPDGCEFTSYETSANGVDALMECDSPDGSKGTVKVSGTISSTTQDMRMEMDMANPMQAGGSMRMVMETQSERIGECAA